MKKAYCIELDETTFRFSGNQLNPETDFQSIEDCTYLVSDFDKTVSRVMQVESDIKYAEAVVVRTLQEEGEFDEPVTVLTHWKKKQGKKNTDIFFTALLSRVYLKYMDAISEHEDLLILIPIFRVLSNLVERISQKNPVAVVFRHGRFADLVIGRNNRFYFATQCVGFDTSEEQIQSLWETVSREIALAAQDNSIKIDRLISLNWIDATEEVPLLPDLEIEHLAFNKTQLIHEQLTHDISFTNALELFPSVEGISPQNGKLFFYANKLSSLVVAFFIIATLINLWMAYSFQAKNKDLAARLQLYEDRILLTKNSIPTIPEKTDYMETLAFADSLFHNRLLLSYKDITNDISSGTQNFTTLDNLQIDYKDKTIQIHLTGNIHAGFDRAYKEYQRLLSHLETKGYTIDKNTFETQIDSSQFDLSVSWRIQ